MRKKGGRVKAKLETEKMEKRNNRCVSEREKEGERLFCENAFI